MKRGLALLAVIMLGGSVTACGDTGLAPEMGDGLEMTPAFANAGTGPWTAQVVGSASGTDDDDGIAERDLNTLAVQVKKFADGSVTGGFMVARHLVHTLVPGLASTQKGFQLHIGASCLSVRAPGNLAVIGGTVERGLIDGLFLGLTPGDAIDVTGLPGLVYVRDNGDGTSSIQTVAGSADCENAPDAPEDNPGGLPFFPADNGNIQIMTR